MNRIRIFVGLLFLLIYLQGISQKLLDVNILLKDSSQNRLLEINVKNVSSESYVIGLQNWQVIPLSDKNKGVVGIPLKADLLNFVFLSDNPNWNSDKLYPLTWEINFDSIPEGSLKILRPKESFTISLLLDDSTKIFLGNKETIHLTYLFRAANYRSIAKRLKGKGALAFLEPNNLIVSNAESNLTYIKNPSGPHTRYYNVAARKVKIDFSRIREMFTEQRFNKVLAVH
jgi:hypothetical protein